MRYASSSEDDRSDKDDDDDDSTAGTAGTAGTIPPCHVAVFFHLCPSTDPVVGEEALLPCAFPEAVVEGVFLLSTTSVQFSPVGRQFPPRRWRRREVGGQSMKRRKEQASALPPACSAAY